MRRVGDKTVTVSKRLRVQCSAGNRGVRHDAWKTSGLRDGEINTSNIRNVGRTLGHPAEVHFLRIRTGEQTVQISPARTS